MRGVPHTLAMATSVDVPPVLFDGTTTPPLQRTGWGGDGAPGNGTLREFAIGAVRQHFTLTTAREAGVDFRLPTSDELDALEAFQLSLGRQVDPDLQSMTMRGAVAESGRQLFLGAAQCNLCHTNAGANSVLAGGNANFNTGVEGLEPLSPLMPADGGFGTAATAFGFGNGTFNTPPLVEAADTPPFFHNNSVETLEGAVAFYATDAFNNSPSGFVVRALTGGPLQLNTEEVTAVAAFLRVLNALENIRSSIAFDERALAARTLADAQKLLELSRFDIRDGIRVLQEAGLHPTAVVDLVLAGQLIDQASTTGSRGPRNALVGRAIDLQERAREDLQ